jgi:energy-coupling factor transport system permease protein
MIRRAGYRAGARGLHRVGPIGNLLVLAGFLAAGLSANVGLELAALAILLVLVLLSDAAPREFLDHLRFVAAFATLLFVAQALSIRDGETLFRLGVPITEAGLLAGASMSLRFLVILTSSFLFVTVTDPDRIAQVLIRTGVPYRYGYVLILALRFVPFFRDELRTVREAQRMRGIRTSVRSLSGLRKAIRFTFVPVLVSGLMRVDSIAMSMKGRCFGLHSTRTNARPERLCLADGLAAVGAAVLVTASILAGRFSWP